MVDKTLIQVKKLSNKKRNGKTLKETLDYGGYSLWWFIEPSVYLRLKGAGKTKIKSDTLVQIVCFILKCFISFKFLLRKVLGKLFASKEKKKPEIIFISALGTWRSITNPNTLKTRRGDAIVEHIIDALEKINFNILGLDRDNSYLINMKLFFEKALCAGKIWKPIEVYLTLSMVKNAFEVSKKLERKWNEVLGQLQDEKKELFKRLTGDFKIYFTYHIFQALLFIEMLKRIIDLQKPKLLVITCEYSHLGRAAVMVGKLKSIPTLALQHGVIHPTHVGYFHTKDEISNKVDPKYCPLPDKTAVFGPYHKHLLTKISAYPKNNVAVTGSSRYDILYYVNKIYSKEKFFRKYKINPNHKIILWTTQCHGLNQEENIKNFIAVFKTMQNLDNVILIIKQHPGEKKVHTKMIKAYIKKYKLKNVILVPKNSDTYEQIFVCDLMITKDSTTGMEAVALNKPVIVLNLSGEPDRVEYVKEGIALGVYKEEDLKPTIEKLLKNDSVLRKNRKKFIRKYLYKIDGKATERVVNLIEKMIQEKKVG